MLQDSSPQRLEFETPGLDQSIVIYKNYLVKLYNKLSKDLKLKVFSFYLTELNLVYKQQGKC